MKNTTQPPATTPAPDGQAQAQPIGLTTGNATVDRVGQMHFEGNIIDHRWLLSPKLRFTNGKLNGPALLVLADLVYWFRPVIVRDPTTNQILEVKKRWPGPVFWKDYATWADSLGLTKRQIQEAVAFLHDAKIITRTVEPIQLPGGAQTNNMPVITLNPDALGHITYGTATRRPAPNPKHREAPPIVTGHPGHQNGRPHTPHRDTVRDTKENSKRTTTTRGTAAPDVDDSLFNGFVEVGVHPNVARSLISADRDECERQLAYLSFRPHPHGPVKALVASVKGKWDAPQSYTAQVAAQVAADLNAIRMRAQSEEDKKAQGEMELAALERARLDDELDAFYKSLDVEERADIDTRAQRRARAIQPKGAIPRRMLLIERRRVCASIANMPEPEEENDSV